MNTIKSTHLGRKIVYSIVIGMSGLILFLSAIGVLGIWLVQSRLSEATVSLLRIVESSAKVARGSVGRVDQVLSALSMQTDEIASASDQLSQNVANRGLVMVLLPEDKEQKLSDAAGMVQDTYQGFHATITSSLELYRSINRLPFVSLPGLDEDQINKIETSLTTIQTSVTTLRSEVADFRSGVTGRIDKITQAANLLNNEITRIKDELTRLDARLAALEAFSIRLQKRIPGLFVTIAVIVTLLLGFVIFTEVEVIRLYVSRWRHAVNIQDSPMADQPAQAP